MLVGVLSDTHDNVRLAVAAARMLVERGARLIVHLGDIVSPFTLAAIVGALPGDVEFRAVYGNNCGEKMRLREVAEASGAAISDPPVELELDGRRILLVHGWGSAGLTRRIVEALAASGSWDAVLYGHTHEVDYRYIRGILLLNPGEASGVLTGRATAALLDTETLRAWILEVPKG